MKKLSFQEELADTPCPACGNKTLIGYLYIDEEENHQHTRYLCCFWGRQGPPCNWNGWVVPTYVEPTSKSEAKQFEADQRLVFGVPLSARYRRDGKTYRQVCAGLHIETGEHYSAIQEDGAGTVYHLPADTLLKDYERIDWEE